jgi:hypothetical protein
MSGTGAAATRPSQFRLPRWAVEFLETMSETNGTTKTEIVVQAIDCLRSREVERLMEEGYREMASLNRGLAEDGLSVSDAESWPLW